MKSYFSGLRRIGLALAMGSVAATGFAQTVADPWAGIVLEANGWTLQGKSDDQTVILYVRFPILRPPGAFPRIWARYEHATLETDSYPAYRSELNLNEFDCTQGRYRVLQQITYSGNNNDGTSRSSNSPGTWEYPAPGTFGETLRQLVCRR